MRPGINSDIICENTRDIKYLRVGAGINGDQDLVTYIDQRLGMLRVRAKRKATAGVSDSEVAAVRIADQLTTDDFAVTTLFSDKDIRGVLARFGMRAAMDNNDVHIDQSLVPQSMAALEAITRLNTLDALKLRVRPAVAETMLTEAVTPRT